MRLDAPVDVEESVATRVARSPVRFPKWALPAILVGVVIVIGSITAAIIATNSGGPSSVVLPEVAGDTPEAKFVNTMRGGLLEHYAVWSKEDVLNIGTTFCHILKTDDTDPETTLHAGAENTELSRQDVDYIIAASRHYICPEADD